jgi:hypothetical protein
MSARPAMFLDASRWSAPNQWGLARRDAGNFTEFGRQIDSLDFQKLASQFRSARSELPEVLDIPYSDPRAAPNDYIQRIGQPRKRGRIADQLACANRQNFSAIHQRINLTRYQDNCLSYVLAFSQYELARFTLSPFA